MRFYSKTGSPGLKALVSKVTVASRRETVKFQAFQRCTFSILASSNWGCKTWPEGCLLLVCIVGTCDRSFNRFATMFRILSFLVDYFAPLL